MATPVIIDTDPGVDDIVALLYALACPELEVVGIVVSFGNTDVDSAFKNVLKLYGALGRHLEKYPEDEKRFPNLRSMPFLAQGARSPLEGKLHDAKYFHGRIISTNIGRDGLGEIDTRYPDITPFGGDQFVRIQETRPAYELAIEAISSRPSRSITYIVLGPLTNLATITWMAPDLCRDRLGRVVIMGGALDVPGNDSAVAEFNFFADPFAAKEVLFGDIIPRNRILLAPLDVTTPHELNFEQYASAVDPSFAFADFKAPSKPEEKSPLAHFSTAFFERTRSVMKRYGKDGMELHDIVVVWCAAMNPPQSREGGLPLLQGGWKATQRLFEIERLGEVTRGMCVVDRRFEAGDAMLALQAEYSTAQPLNHDHKAIRDLVAKEEGREAELERKIHDFPAQVQVESEELLGVHPKGVACVVQTPGPGALVTSMLERIWGAQCNM